MKQRNEEISPILFYPVVFASLFALLLAAAAPALAQKSVSTKPRTIVTTDGETDDKSSFTRFLLYTTDFDIAGLIYTNSKWHLKGNGTRWMHDYIDEYAKVYQNLRVHHPDYPDPNNLKSLLYVGQLEQVGRAAVGEGKDTPGSDRIVEVLLDDDPRPVWLQAWGGLNNICQAFYRIKTSHPEQLPKVNQKARVYAIAEQDDLKEWLQTEMPEVMYLLNGSQFWRVIAYAPDRKNPLHDHEVYSEGWVSQHIKSTGPLGATYTRKVQEEGDSPAFFHLIQTGLRSTAHPSWGGWGGRFSHQGPGNFWVDAKDDGDNTKPLWRFIVPLSEDFAARMRWTVSPAFKDANHAPLVKLKHGENRKVKAGKTVDLNASPTTDPDGDALDFKWWVYPEAGSYGKDIPLQNAASPKAQLSIPKEARGKDIHVILEVKDRTEFPMIRYCRVILKVE